jgi:CheY-like chemotaxis protein
MSSILLVEDDAAIASLLAWWLRDAGHTVTERTGGFEGLSAPEPWRGVDVLVTDLMLGGQVTGRQVLGWCARWAPGARRVVLSAIADLRDIHDAHVVLAKPSDPAVILRAVEGGP